MCALVKEEPAGLPPSPVGEPAMTGAGQAAEVRHPRAKLSRDQVAKAALHLIDVHGLDALTMRALADELGVGTMTLYGYFRSKEELLDAMIDAAVSDREPPAAEGTWREQARLLSLEAWENLTRHPGLVQIRVARPVLRPQALRFAEAGLRILQGAGFEPREAAQAFRLIFTYTFGFATFSPEVSAEEARRAAREALEALPSESYPMLRTAGQEASEAMAGREQFEYGLARILDGLEARLRG